MSATVKLSNTTVLTKSANSKVENDAASKTACHHFILMFERGLEISMTGPFDVRISHSHYNEGPAMGM